MPPFRSVVYTIVKQPKGGKTMEIENEVTIATHNGSQVARQHNLRNPKVIAKEDHIDPNGHFEVWLDEDPKPLFLLWEINK